MPTLNQIQANRLNSQKSTGPRSPEGKAVSRFNALKTGIHAHSHVIPGEDPGALEALTLEYHDRFQPAAPERRFLVDALVAAEWQLRRLRKAEAEIWEYGMQEWRPEEDLVSSGRAFILREEYLTRLHRRIDSAERSYYRALKELHRLQETESRPAPPEPEPVAKPILLPAAGPQVIQKQTPHPQIGFVPPNALLAPRVRQAKVKAPVCQPARAANDSPRREPW